MAPYILRLYGGEICRPGMYVAYHLVSQSGHFFAVEVTDDGRAILSDDAMEERAVTTSELFTRSLRSCEGYALFILLRDVEDAPLKEEIYYAHGGYAPPVNSGGAFHPPQKRCLYCNCSLAKYRVRTVQVLSFNGLVGICDAQKRCVSKNCRAIYSANYVKNPENLGGTLS